jgi:hypothetical protein
LSGVRIDEEHNEVTAIEDVIAQSVQLETAAADSLTLSKVVLPTRTRNKKGIQGDGKGANLSGACVDEEHGEVTAIEDVIAQSVQLETAAEDSLALSKVVLPTRTRNKKGV